MIVQEEECRKVKEWGALKNVSDAEIVQEEECYEVREWGELKSVSDAEIKCKRRRTSVVKLDSGGS